MTGSEALRAAVVRLREAGVPDAPGDARRLLAHALAIDAGRLTLHAGDPLGPAPAAAFEAAVAQRCRRRPVSQIVGHRDFFGHRFRVTSDTLDPRPETELLVAVGCAEPFVRLLDLGTGSGCVLLSCLAARPGARGLGTDLSEAALAVARGNAADLGLGGRADFARADWFEGVAGRFDLILSNPPYIAAGEMAALAPEVRLWEPEAALTPGGDGLDAYRAIAAGAAGHLAPGGRLAVEIGPTQARAVAGLFEAAGLGAVTVARDLDGRDRVVAARGPGG